MGALARLGFGGRGIGRLPGATPDPNVAGFPQILLASDIMASTTAIIVAGFTRIGAFTVPAQTEFQFGVGDPDHPENQGYLYVSIFDDTCIAVQEDGVIRLLTSDNGGFNSSVIFERHTAQLRGSTTDRKLQIPFPLVGRRLLHNDLMVLEMQGAAADTVVAADSTIYLPVTRFNTGRG